MGPRSFDRGKVQSPCPPTAAPPCFNGAAIFRSRKELIPVNGLFVVDLLQWGRDLSIAESLMVSPNLIHPAMLQWGRDLSIAERLWTSA